MEDQTNELKEVIVFDLPTFPDDRGFFREVVRFNDLETKIGTEFKIKQFSHSRSSKNTLRGIHVAPWNKLLYVTRGKIQAVLVDCREGSATYGKYKSVILGDENKVAVFVPKGFGNSFLVLSDDADYVYLVDEEWSLGREKTIAWNDPKLNIQWELNGNEPVLSEKDKQAEAFG